MSAVTRARTANQGRLASVRPAKRSRAAAAERAAGQASHWTTLSVGRMSTAARNGLSEDQRRIASTPTERPTEPEHGPLAGSGGW